MNELPAELKLSPSQVEEWERSPRRFWLEKRGVMPKPRGIFPSLPAGMDKVLKAACDSARGTAFPLAPGLHSWLKERDLSLCTNQAILEPLRHARKATDVVLPGIRMGWAIDDILVTPGGTVAVFDWKTRASAPNDEDVVKYYQTKADLYALGLAMLGHAVEREAVYATVFPVVCIDSGTGAILVEFHVKPTVFEVSPGRGQEKLEACAASVRGPIPTQDDEWGAWAASYQFAQQFDA